LWYTPAVLGEGVLFGEESRRVGKETDRLNIIEQLKELKQLKQVKQIKEVTKHLWILGLSIQAALGIALPVLLGVGVGWWLDHHLRPDSFPWITVVLTAVGIFAGPVIIYRWVTRKVEQRLRKEKGA